MKDDGFYLRHILDSITQIKSYTAPLDYKGFRSNQLVQDAVIRQLEIIGEASKNLSDALRNSSTNVPWEDIAGMRDKLIHHYFGVDLQAVWDTATLDLPAVEVEIKRIIKAVKG